MDIANNSITWSKLLFSPQNSSLPSFRFRFLKKAAQMMFFLPILSRGLTVESGPAIIYGRLF